MGVQEVVVGGVLEEDVGGTAIVLDEDVGIPLVRANLGPGVRGLILVQRIASHTHDLQALGSQGVYCRCELDRVARQ